MTLHDVLTSLPLGQEDRDESLGQGLDILAQGLEHYSADTLKVESRRRSFGGHARLLEKHGVTGSIPDSLAAVRARRREVMDGFEVEQESLQDLLDLIGGLLFQLGADAAPYRLRIRYRPVMVNTAGIETPRGFRQFQLHHGSAIRIPCDVLVISARMSSSGVEGQLANALDGRYDLSPDPTSRLLSIADGVWTTCQPAPSEAPFSKLLTLWMPEETEQVNDVYGRAVAGVFASLMALEHLDGAIEHVGLSFLGGHRVSDMDTAVQTLIFAAMHWLKRSERGESIRCALLQVDELEAWDASMNRALGRVYVGGHEDPLLDALRREVLEQALPLREGPLAPALVPLVEALRGQGPLCVELVCTFSRTLAERIVNESIQASGKKPGGDLLSKIEDLRKGGSIAPWVCSYMHGLRVLGNKSVHPPNQPPRYLPQKLGKEDLLAALSATGCLLSLWQAAH